MKNVNVSIEYELDIELDDISNELFEEEFFKLRKIISNDTEDFIISSLNNPNIKTNKKIIYELQD